MLFVDKETVSVDDIANFTEDTVKKLDLNTGEGINFLTENKEIGSTYQICPFCHCNKKLLLLSLLCPFSGIFQKGRMEFTNLFNIPKDSFNYCNLHSIIERLMEGTLNRVCRQVPEIFEELLEILRGLPRRVLLKHGLPKQIKV